MSKHQLRKAFEPSVEMRLAALSKRFIKNYGYLIDDAHREHAS